ncbi:MAG: HPr family phosphocarrier protein [Planctomycetota bacterium]|nr:HPr family phosphocarrier protein [Planctomycetota bacterium]
MPEIVRTVRVPNPAGLHARPCQAIATIVQRHEAALRVACDGLEVDGRSILELMTLCAPCESTLTLRATGADADELVRSVATLVENGFGEMT